jgi:hypothetical protein
VRSHGSVRSLGGAVVARVRVVRRCRVFGLRTLEGSVKICGPEICLFALVPARGIPENTRPIGWMENLDNLGKAGRRSCAKRHSCSERLRPLSGWSP